MSGFACKALSPRANQLPLFCRARKKSITKVHVFPLLALYLRNDSGGAQSQTRATPFRYTWSQMVLQWNRRPIAESGLCPA